MNGTSRQNGLFSLHSVFAGVVFICSLILFSLTVQRTIPLWDCGEFIACSYILGIAHPPGTPLFLLIGRVFSLLPIVADISLRVNLISVISGAVAATFAYLVSVRLLFMIPGVSQNAGRRLAAYLSSVVGAFLFAFCHTNWSNSVEAEVYSLSMVLIFAIIWLSLLWYDKRGTATGMRYLVMLSYLGIAGIGVHMTVFLVMPVVFVFIVIADFSLRRDPRFWITAVLMFMVTVDIIWFVVGLAIWIGISVVSYMGSRSNAWMLALLISAVSLLGFSNHAYIPIRAAHKPSINENNPDNLKRFVDYIARKQYGDQSMFKKMFKRRASWAHQLGNFPRMGFGGFLLKQYGMPGLYFLFPLLLVILGMITLIKWKWKIGLYIVLALLLFNIGLVIYMNFADGSAIDRLTGNDKLEVRDRDYFFTPGFVLFGLCIGLGVFAVINRIIDRLGEKHAIPIAALLGILALLMPVAAVSANYRPNDRSNNFVAYNYAYNLLTSCPKDAIIFTSGDNDTFPVWCMQEVYGFRKDVRVVNLSLLQIDWYQLQMKYEKGVPISFKDEQMIWAEQEDGRSGQKRYYPEEPYYDALRDWTHPLVAFQDQETGELVSVAHQMIENIIGANKWKYPILFASSYPTQVKYPLSEHALQRGMVWEIVREKTDGGFDKQRSLELFKDEYRYTGLDDPRNYRDEVATSLVIGDAQTLMEFADNIERKGDTATALEVCDLTMQRIPEFWQSYARKAIYEKSSEAATDSLFDQYLVFLEKLIDYNPDNLYYYQYRGMFMQYLGRLDEATKAYEESYELNPAIQVTYHSLVAVYVQTGRREDAIRISREFLQTNPYSSTAQAVVAGRF